MMGLALFSGCVGHVINLGRGIFVNIIASFGDVTLDSSFHYLHDFI